MKKLIALATVGALLLSGCGITTPKTSPIFVAPAALTEGEQKLLKLVEADEDILLFDYTFDDSVKTITVDILTLNDQKQWESSGKIISGSNMSKDTGKNGRIMIAPNADGSIKFAEQHENGKTSYSSDAGLLDSLAGDGAKLTNRLQDSVDIVYDQPIPLAMFARSTKNSIRSYSLSEYKDTSLLADYDAVSVITICFSQKEIS